MAEENTTSSPAEATPASASAPTEAPAPASAEAPPAHLVAEPMITAPKIVNVSIFTAKGGETRSTRVNLEREAPPPPAEGAGESKD